MRSSTICRSARISLGKRLIPEPTASSPAHLSLPRTTCHVQASRTVGAAGFHCPPHDVLAMPDVGSGSADLD